MALIHEAMAKIMRSCEAITKDSVNQQQGFKFRSVEATYKALHDLFAEHQVFIAPEVIDHKFIEKTTKSGGLSTHHFLLIRYTFYASDGSSVPMVLMGESADNNDKGCAKACSMAIKNTLFQAFLIPTENTPDPDADTPNLIGRAKKRPYTPEQEEVLAQKLGDKRAEATGKTAPQAPATTGNFEMLKAFKEIKAKLNKLTGTDTAYYNVLGVNGYQKSNEITKREDGRRIYQQLANLCIEIELEKEGVKPNA